MNLICLDMEGVLVPEIWIAVAQKTGIAELKLTTRDIPDYDKLMLRRLQILRANRIGLRDIQSVISRMQPLPGAKVCLDKLRHQAQVIILSDTYYEFAMPLMKKLGFPTLLCNALSVDNKGYISNYHLRQTNGKKSAVEAFRSLGFRVVAAGDSYNDIAMLKAADKGVLFNPPDKIKREYPQFPVTRDYASLRKALL